jgi:ribose transport system permease protein
MSATQSTAPSSEGAPVTGQRPRRRLPESIATTGPLLVAILGLGAYTATRSDLFLTQRNLENILQQSSVLGLLTVGMTLLMIAGLLDLSVGSATAFVSVVAAKLANDGHSSTTIVLVALATGFGISLVIGTIVGMLSVRPFILTLGFLSVFLSLGLVLSKGQPVPLESDVFTTLGVGKWLGIPASGVLFIAALVVGALVLRYARLGRNAYAMGSNEQAAYLAGVPISRTTIGLFVISGLLVGVAGCVQLGRLGAGDPNAGTGLELQAVAAVVLGGGSLNGGRGTIWGSFLGVLFLGEVSNALNILGTEIFYQQLVYGAVLIIAVIATTLREQRRLPTLAALRRAGRSRREQAATASGDERSAPR